MHLPCAALNNVSTLSFALTAEEKPPPSTVHEPPSPPSKALNAAAKERNAELALAASVRERRER
jgi:hypothetical protein